MKIESISVYDQFDTYCNHILPTVVYEHEFVSLHDVARWAHEFLKTNKLGSAIIFMQNHRYLYVRENSYDVHYHQFF